MSPEFKKREIAYKIKIGDLHLGNQIFEESQSTPENPNIQKRLICVELGNKKIVRVNILANIIDKYSSEGDRRFASLTIDDGSGQIRARVFGEDINKFSELSQGDTVLIIGVLRSYNNELYLLPEIIKKQDPRYLLIRKLDIEKEQKTIPPPPKEKVKALRDEIIEMIKSSEESEGIEAEELIIKIKAEPALITQEIKKLLEEGIIYEPRPGKLRYLG